MIMIKNEIDMTKSNCIFQMNDYDRNAINMTNI